MSQKTQKQDKFGLELNLQLKTGQKAENLAKAIKPELNAAHARRSKTSIGIKKTSLSITIKALDPTALRAALNGCLKSIILANDVTEV